MQLNYIAIFVITLLAFFGWAFWHGPLFGKLWMKIHWGENTPSEKEQKEMMKGMWKLLLTEYIVTLFMVFSLAWLMQAIPEYSGIRIALISWIGFVVPMTVSNIIWGGDKKQYWIQKILITISYRLIVFIFAGYILSIWK